MAAILQLPEKRDTEALNRAFDDMLSPAVRERNVHQVGWFITDAFLQGIREFHSLNMEEGTVDISYESPDGEFHMRWDEPLTKLQTEIGRLSRLDTTPLVKKRAFSLESLRQSSLAQVLLHHVVGTPEEEMLKIRFFTGLVMYGTYAIARWRDPFSENPLDQEVELIPPWELLPTPAETSNPTDVRGIFRTRLYPLKELKADAKRRGERWSQADEDLMEIVDLPYGSSTALRSYSGEAAPTGAGSYSDLFDKHPTKRKGQASQGQPLGEQFVRLQELWTTAPRGRVARYIRRAGRVFLSDQDYLTQNLKVPFPLGIARFEETGRFYGRSLASKVIPIAMELERLLQKLFQNVADMDRFGFLLVPDRLGIDLEAFKSTETPRVIPYEVDYADPSLKVGQIEPVTASEVPGKVMQFGLSLLDRIVAQGPLFEGQAPGRGDSGAFISALSETGSTHLLPVAAQIEAAYATTYRYTLYDIRDRMGKDSRPSGGIELTKIDNAIAGVTLDPMTGKLILSPSDVPDPWSVDLGIKSRDPNARLRRREEAPGLLQSGLLTPLEFIILNYQESWDYPIGNRGVWENYVKAVLYNIIMFGDGETPGQPPWDAIFSETADKPEVHLMAVEDFTASPEFMLSSAAVQNAFFERMNELRARVGQKLPEGLPSIDQAALMAGAQGNGRMQMGATRG
jgi:hypothetical protein